MSKQELDQFQQFLRDLTKEVRELYGELTIYRLMYGALPYDDEGKLEVAKMRQVAEGAKGLQKALDRAAKEEGGKENE